jgi:hypothetical protein
VSRWIPAGGWSVGEGWPARWRCPVDAWQVAAVEWRRPSAVAESADEAAVAQAIEALRKAFFGQDKTQLEALCADELSYGHSDGRVENKAQFINRHYRE